MHWVYDSVVSNKRLPITRSVILPSSPFDGVGTRKQLISELNNHACVAPSTHATPTFVTKGRVGDWAELWLNFTRMSVYISLLLTGLARRFPNGLK